MVEVGPDNHNHNHYHNHNLLSSYVYLILGMKVLTALYRRGRSYQALRSGSQMFVQNYPWVYCNVPSLKVADSSNF